MRRFNVVVALFVAVVTGCDPQVNVVVPNVGDGEARAALDRAPCDADTTAVSVAIAQMLTGENVLEREVHDCQRLIENGAYGPLVAVYPVQSALSLPEGAFTNTWRMVATMYNWGLRDGTPQAYAPLDIAPGLNCLFLRTSANTWEASVRPAPCSAPGPGPVVVARQTYAGADTALPDRPIYPKTVRFRWHSGPGIFSISLKCADAWCSVGPQSAVGSLPQTLTGNDVERTVPGYFDEQPLLLFNAAMNTQVVGPVGRIYPTDALRIANGHNAPGNAWSNPVHVAVMEVDRPQANVGGFDRYVRKFGLTVGGVGGQLGVANLEVAAPSSGNLMARTVSMLGVPGQTGRLERVVNTKHSADATVRWRWIEQDEAAWVPCQGTNCCTAVF